MAEEAGLVSVRIKLFGFLARYGSQQDLVLQTQSGSSVAEVLQNLVEMLGSDFQHALLDSRGNLNGGVEVILNGEHISAYQLARYQIIDDSEIILFPMIAGGRL